MRLYRNAELVQMYYEAIGIMPHTEEHAYSMVSSNTNTMIANDSSLSFASTTNNTKSKNGHGGFEPKDFCQ